MTHLNRSLYLLFCLTLPNWWVQAAEQNEALPQPVDKRLQIELYAEHPQIVTPTGIDVDEQGRVWAIESNTHFPPEGYQGHSSDRIIVFTGRNKQNRAQQVKVFADGFKHTMSIAVMPDWLKMTLPRKHPLADRNKLFLFVATRQTIYLLTDSNSDLLADSRKSLVKLETAGTYPHNGLAGFAFDAYGKMYFGLGENLGADYRLIGQDNATFSGGGEGGNIYSVLPDGTQLTRMATGFWNPHASCVDAFGRLFSVDNDPDSRPPCRLMHIIPHGDFGYRFRNGRAGLHPFTSWNGELPGTLPMVAGTGEAPSGIVAYESDGLPQDYRGNLLVTSWGDHSIDRFVLKKNGLSFSSKREPVIQGGENFRPVGLATAPDGSLFLTDWVLRDYKLHSRGRIWRISSPKLDKKIAKNNSQLSPETPEKQLRQAINSPNLSRRRLAAHLLARANARTLMGVIRNPQATDRARYEALTAWVHQKNNSWDRVISMQRTTTNQAPFTPFHTAVSRYSGEKPQILELLKILEAPSQNDPDYLRLGLESIRPLIRILGRSQSKVAVTLLNRLVQQQDQFLFCTVIQLMAETLEEDELINTIQSKTPLSTPLRLSLLLAGRKQAPKSIDLIKAALARPEPELKQATVQWIAEENLQQFQPRLIEIMGQPDLPGNLFEATLAALQMLEGVKRDRKDEELGIEYLFQFLTNQKYNPTLRARALPLVPPLHKKLTDDLLLSFLESGQPSMVLAAVKTLQLASRTSLTKHIRNIASSSSQPNGLRAQAIVALSRAVVDGDRSSSTVQLLVKLAKAEQEDIQQEALRSLRGLVEQEQEVQQLMAQFKKSSSPTLSAQAALALKLPQVKHIPQNLMQGGDAAAGERIFFHPHAAGCFRCHTIHRRGAHIGPDLSVVARTLNREKLIQSILKPSKEIAPQFTVWTFLLNSGKVHNGLIIGEGNKRTLKVGTSEGKIIAIPQADIEQRTPQRTSIMPEKLANQLTQQEFLDLLAFLQTLK